jgi:hypothetical protein
VEVATGRERPIRYLAGQTVVRPRSHHTPPERDKRRKLAPAGGKPLRIATDQSEDQAREAAVKLAALTRLAIDDEVERERAREAAGLDEENEA